MVTAEALNRTFFIKIGQHGTGTVVDYDGKQYLVTARHLLEGKEDLSVIDFYFADHWLGLGVSVVGIGKGELDIAVFAPKDMILCPPHLTYVVGSGGISLSQDVYFLGYPYKMHTKGGSALRGRPCPFVRKGILSSLFDDGYGIPKLYIDAINNEGFSGGPIVFYNTQTRRIHLAGIVAKYRTERERVLCDQGDDIGASVAINTGITIGYDISEAIKLIQANPIGLKL